MNTGFPASALSLLADKLTGCEASWVVGGSTGLSLRGASLERPPRDLDVYADLASVPILHARLSEYAVDGPAENETERYRSILSHYSMEETIVELVGHFRVRAVRSEYMTEVDDVLYPNADIIHIKGHQVRLVPLAHELIFNLLRERMDRASVVGELIAHDPARHLPLLYKLLATNHISPDVAQRALSLAAGAAVQEDTR
ncbi:nucleotidyltransferase family protein [Cohnella kolymensis]|uniref:hypothetical protein n=1 Tax=Cohnella kolymensis TaxID=1590652 RepID=UPI000698B224|nr:hypothetical protein [Cohnella kolymensis]